ncbi:MAG: CHAP domain-containing protein [Acidimicrobiales bacterium]
MSVGLVGLVGLIAAFVCTAWAPVAAAGVVPAPRVQRAAVAAPGGLAGEGWSLSAGGEVLPGGSKSTTPGLLIAAVANSQVGESDPYDYGPSGSTWCAYFASWVWRRAGVAIPPTGPAAYVGTWDLAHGGAILPPSSKPAPGDAVLWVGAGTLRVWPDEAALAFPDIEHVNIVTQVLGNGEIVTVGGNETGAVRRTGPFSPEAASSYFGQAIYGFVRPPA